MTPHIPDVASWFLAAGAVLAAALLLRQRQRTGVLGERIDSPEETVRARDEEARLLATVHLPAVAAGQHGAGSGPHAATPDATVEVNLQAAHNGACIVIDDAGVGMDAPRRARRG